jgi:hypothetical protein
MILAFIPVAWSISPALYSLAVKTLKLNSINACPRDTIQTMSCVKCASLVPLVDLNVREHWYAAYDPSLKTVIVSFKGTAAWEDWLDSTQMIIKQPVLNAEVQATWNLQVVAILDPLHEMLAILAQKHPNSNILYTGHSGGAALALLSAVYGVYQRQLNPDYVQVLVSGLPRIGNDAFRKLVARAGFQFYYRLSNSHDVVTLLPPEFLGYKHSTREIYINAQKSNATAVICADELPDFSKGGCSNRYTYAELLLSQYNRLSANHAIYLGVEMLECK